MASLKSPLALFCLLGALLSGPAAAGPLRDAEVYRAAVKKINEAHLKNPGVTREEELRRKLPASASAALERILREKESPELPAALGKCGEASLDLAMMEDFLKISERLAGLDPAASARLGSAVATSRCVIRGIGPFEPGYLERFGEICEGVLDAYDSVFGFAEYSKVPGKKVRIRVRAVPSITHPPHFAPEFPWHSEVDFPVADTARFTSPTAGGQFLFYGLCHEFGHLVAMWGDPAQMEDHHAWAHYTGTVIVEYLSEKADSLPWMSGLSDVKWRSLKIERAAPENQTVPSFASQGGVMALLIGLHDKLGPRVTGKALNRLEEDKKCRRVNQVRYYSFSDFAKSLKSLAPAEQKTLDGLFRKK